MCCAAVPHLRCVVANRTLCLSDNCVSSFVDKNSFGTSGSALCEGELICRVSREQSTSVWNARSQHLELSLTFTSSLLHLRCHFIARTSGANISVSVFDKSS